MDAWIWLLFAIALFAIELTRGDMYFVWWAIAAVAAFFFAANPLGALVIFVLFGLALYLLVRPAVVRRFMPIRHRDPPDELIGQTGVVLKQVNPLSDFSGLVDINGRRWAARSFGTEPIPPGTDVEVLGLDGIQLLVHPVGQSLVSTAPTPPPSATRGESSS